MQPSSPSRILGRYALYAEIASGGMATVHYGRLLGPVGFSRTVAIKRLHPQFAREPEFVSMFLDEARLAARIAHPNVVPTLDVVATEGELFLVMEYVQGESVARLLRSAREAQQRIPPEIAVAIAVGALHGLHAAHEATSERGEPLNLVHRDVSPQNILVGADGTPRVLDFGVAKAAGALHTTRDGQLKGKLAYMSPEQIRGRVTRATDIYAAAVVLWEMLVGRRLFQAEGEAELFGRVLEAVVEPPSMHAPGIPPELDAHILRALDRDPTRRFATARDMARAIEKSVPLVSASDVGEWVGHIAGRGLAERAQRVATIENSSVDHIAAAQHPPPSAPGSSPYSPSHTPSRPSMPHGPMGGGSMNLPPLNESTRTELSSASLTDGNRPPVQNVRTSLIVAIGGLALSVVVLLSVQIGLRLRRPPSTLGAAPEAPVTSMPLTPPATTIVVPAPTAVETAPVPPAESAPLPAPAAEEAPSAVPSATVAARPRPPAATANRPPSPPAAKGKPLGTVLDSRK